MQTWKMHPAKARLSGQIKHAAQQGPQGISQSGKSTAVGISRELFDRLSGNEQTLLEFMRSSPLAGQEEINFKRDNGPGSLPREVLF